MGPSPAAGAQPTSGLRQRPGAPAELGRVPAPLLRRAPGSLEHQSMLLLSGAKRNGLPEHAQQMSH